MIYVIGGLLLMCALLGGWAKIERSERHAAEASLTACQADIKRQNEAVEALRAESAKKAATVAAALVKAEKKAKVWDDQAKRLTAVLASRKPTDPQDCKAAWQELRK